MASNPGLKTLYHEFININQDRRGIYEEQVIIQFPDGEEKPLHLEIVVTPKYGPFRGGRLLFDMVLHADYPKAKPVSVKCKSKVFHPNISYEGNVCFNMFGGDWTAEYRLEHFVNGILWLLQNPNPDSCLNSNAAVRDPIQYEKKVQMALRGLSVGGTTFTPIVNPATSMFMDPILFKSIEELFTALVNKNPYPLSAFGSVGLKTLAFPQPVQSYMNVLFDNSVLFESNANSDPNNNNNSPKKVSELVSVIGHSVKTRAKLLKVQPSSILKELVFRVVDPNNPEEEGSLILVITNGFEKVDLEHLASLLKVEGEIVRVTPGSIKHKTGWDYTAIPAFGHPLPPKEVATSTETITTTTTETGTETISDNNNNNNNKATSTSTASIPERLSLNHSFFSHIVVNENIFSEDILYTASGHPRYLLKISSSILREMILTQEGASRIITTPLRTVSPTPEAGVLEGQRFMDGKAKRFDFYFGENGYTKVPDCYYSQQTLSIPSDTTTNTNDDTNVIINNNNNNNNDTTTITTTTTDNTNIVNNNNNNPADTTTITPINNTTTTIEQQQQQPTLTLATSWHDDDNSPTGRRALTSSGRLIAVS